MRFIQRFMLLLILVVMESCTMIPVEPRYEPLPPSSNWGLLRQGYFDWQIDDRTYLIGYSNYHTALIYLGSDWSDESEKWLKGAQEYVLYRASELTKSKGQRSFVVLYKDDWLYAGYVDVRSRYGRHLGRRIEMSPGAWAIIRVMDEAAMTLQTNDDRVYLADILLDGLARENSGLAKYHRPVVPSDHQDQYVPKKYQRWRPLSSAYDSISIPGVQYERLGRGTNVDFEAGSKVTEVAPGRYTFAVWQEDLISPIQMLWQCIWHAEREGYKIFKVENWTIEEHIGQPISSKYIRKGWFKSTMDVVPQQQQEPASLDPVFVVDEIRARFFEKGAPYPY